MQGMRRPLQLVVFLGCMSPLAHAALNCGGNTNADTYPGEIGLRHHPIGKPLPTNSAFNQPVDCGDGAWFFDMNRNGTPEPGEPRVFGPERVIGCSSCHGDSPDPKSEAAASVFLRQDPNVLCLVCHSV